MTNYHRKNRYLNFNQHYRQLNFIKKRCVSDGKRYDNFHLYVKYSEIQRLLRPPPPPPPPPHLLPPPLSPPLPPPRINSISLRRKPIPPPPISTEMSSDINKPFDEPFYYLSPLKNSQNAAKDAVTNLSSIISKYLNKTTDPDETPIQLKKKVDKNLPFEILKEKLETISDLIKLGEKYETDYKDSGKRYNLNVETLSNLVDPLKDLEKMIGMKNIKKSIFNKIILSLQGLNNDNLDYNHIVLYGGPGMGKTHVAKIIGKIYANMGILSKGDFIEAKLTDLKGGYLGQSELKTQELLDKCKGSVLFLDEAYSLGSEDKIDSFSQSIIDIINPFLDKYKDDFIFIVAGYKDDLDNRFFKGNQGLKSRFGLWLEIDKYSPKELLEILKKKITSYNWKYKDDISEDFFKDNMESFKFFGRDIETLFSKCKISHAQRVLYAEESEKKIISKEDLTKGFELFLKDRGGDKDADELEKIMLSGLYS